ncbi:hypothetical protein BGW39_003382, partial [Mortierella sp. 14UC]
MLLSTRLVHELDLTLDWNTSFEDLRILKGVMQQSNVFHLGLNLCGKIGPTSDFVYRNRRAEPIVQMMASGKIHTMTLRNTTGFLSQTKDPLKATKLHIRHFDLGETIASVDDFSRLERLVRGSPMLLRLSVLVGDIDQAFEQLKPIIARHKTLSILNLQLQDGTAASIQFEQGSDKILTIALKVVEPGAIKLMQMPMVTSVELLAMNTMLQTSEHTYNFVKKYRSLKTVKIAQMPAGGADMLRMLWRAVDDYCVRLEGKRTVSEEGVSEEAVETGQVERSMAGPRYMELLSIHRRTVLSNLTLLVASVDERETREDVTTANEFDMNRRRSIFIAWRDDGSLALVQFELEDGGSDSMVLHIGTFDASEVFQHIVATKLTVIGNDGFQLLDELMKEPVAHCNNIRTLEFESRRRDVLDILPPFEQAVTHYPALNQLNLWNIDNGTMEEFTLPLWSLNLSRHSISGVQLPSLRHLLNAASALSRLRLLVPSVAEVFEIVKSAAQLHKQLSYVQLNEGTSRLSAKFIVGSGEVHSISLRILESELGKLLSLPKVTELTILNAKNVYRIKPLMLSIFMQYRHLKVFSMHHGSSDLMESIDEVQQASNETSISCQVVFTNSNPGIKPMVFDLPLKTLVIPTDDF